MKKALLWILTFGTSLALSGVGIELFLRHAGVVAPIISYYHEDLGLFTRPNLDWIKFKEGFFIGESLSRSRFGEDYPQEKPEGTYRIALVGDSYVEGLDVLSRHHFRRVLETELNERTGQRIEVLNFGRGNSTLPFTAYMTLEYALDYAPDLVLFFTEGRDRNPPQWSGRTGYELKDGELIVNRSWRDSTNYRIFQWIGDKPVLNRIVDLSTLALVNRVNANIRLRSLSWILLDKFHPFVFPDANRGPEGRVRPSRNRKPVEISDISERIMRKLVARSRQGDPEFLFILRPLPAAPAPELEALMLDVGADYLDLGDIFEGGRGDILIESGIDAKYFKASGASGGHWNHEGHRAVGHYLADKVYERFESGADSDSRR